MSEQYGVKPGVQSPEGHRPPDGGLRVSAAYADAVLASKKHLDEAASMVAGIPGGEMSDDTLDDMIRLDKHIQLGTGYARLASALQKPPGQRF